MRRKAQIETQWALVTSGVTSARLYSHQLRQLLVRAQALIKSLEDAEGFHQIAGDLVTSIPETFDQLENQLDECQLALAYMGRKQLKDKVSPEAKQRIERALKSAPHVASMYLKRQRDVE